MTSGQDLIVKQPAFALDSFEGLPVVTDPGRLRMDPLERAWRQMLAPTTTEFLQRLADVGVAKFSTDEMLQLASLLDGKKPEHTDERCEFLALAETQRGPTAGLLVIIEETAPRMRALLRKLAATVPALRGARVTKHGDSYALEHQSFVASIEDDATERGLGLLPIIRAANTILAKLSERKRLVGVLQGAVEVYALVEVSQAVSLGQLGVLVDSLEETLALGSW